MVAVSVGPTWSSRMLGVFTAGRILNEKTARSQAIGGMISSALSSGVIGDS